MYKRGHEVQSTMTLHVLVSSNLPHLIQLHVCFRVVLYELYPIDAKKCSMSFSLVSESGLYM